MRRRVDDESSRVITDYFNSRWNRYDTNSSISFVISTGPVTPNIFVFVRTNPANNTDLIIFLRRLFVLYNVIMSTFCCRTLRKLQNRFSSPSVDGTGKSHEKSFRLFENQFAVDENHVDAYLPLERTYWITNKSIVLWRSSTITLVFVPFTRRFSHATDSLDFKDLSVWRNSKPNFRRRSVGEREIQSKNFGHGPLLRFSRSVGWHHRIVL